MLLARTRRMSYLVVAVLMSWAFGLESSAQEARLGKVDFATSGSEKAQARFLRGLAALHSFWFEEALEEFRESTRIEPGFRMGYWGEAMAHNHPLWSEQETDAARKVLEKITDTGTLSPRERAYLNAVRILYGEGDKLTRDRAYSAAMEKIYREYPDDNEAALFYALSLLGTVRPDDKGYRREALAGAIALEVFGKNPNHPGAAHYIIHAFDDPDHAILALPAAQRYAEIAPEAHHARHMPSHIFLQLGMWPDAARSNESSWAASDAWVKRKNLSISLREYHSLSWLLYVYLQQGRFNKAEESLDLMRKTLAESESDNKLRPNYYQDTYARMTATFVVETERWHLAADLFPSSPSSFVERPSGRDKTSGEHASHQPAQELTSRRSNQSQTLPVFVRGLAAGMMRKPGIDESIATLRALGKEGAGSPAGGLKTLEIRQLELAAVAALVKGNFNEAVEQVKKATVLEEGMSPPSGPPSLLKPSHELLGEVLLRANRPNEAAEQFRTALLRQPNRARSLLGAARAAAKNGDRKTATEMYSIFLRQWQQADPQLPELIEAQDYLGKGFRP